MPKVLDFPVLKSSLSEAAEPASKSSRYSLNPSLVRSSNALFLLVVVLSFLVRPFYSSDAVVFVRCIFSFFDAVLFMLMRFCFL